MQLNRVQIEFDRLFTQVFQADRASVEVSLAVDAGQKDESVIDTGNGSIRISGRSKNTLLCGIYTFYENCGMKFLITGSFFAGRERLKEVPQIYRRLNASILNRGIRMHLNFVQDQSFFSEQDFKAFIENMSRMKMNYLLFHMYNSQEWYPFEYRGVKHLELELGNLGRKPLPDDMAGREKIKTKKVWYPKELEDITDTEELMEKVQIRYQEMMAYAKEFGIRLAASFEPEVVSDVFEEKLREWADEEGTEKKYSLTADWQEGWSGKKIADVSTTNPVLKDMAVRRALCMYEAYPLLDELHLISREGTSYQADTREEYINELRRLETSLNLTFTEEYIEELFTENEEKGSINPKAYPYWTVLPGDSYAGSVIGAFRYLEFAVRILEDGRLKKLEEEKGLKFVISLYSPNPRTIELVSRYAGKIIPEGIRFDILGDYGARDICRQMESWRPIQEDGRELGMVSWLEFDGNMDLAQCWTRAIYDNVEKAAAMNIRTVYFNHWRLHSLEQNADIAARTCFDAAGSYGQFMDEYAGSTLGENKKSAGCMAFKVLEEATAFCKEHHYNIGFTNDWVYQHSTDSPGYRWQELEHSSRLYERAEAYFRETSEGGEGRFVRDGSSYGEYMADMCRISRFHLQAVLHLQKSKLPLMGYQCFPVSREGNWPDPDTMKNCLHEAYLALQYTYAYMKGLAKWVEGSDEQGQLAHHQLGMVSALEYHYRTLKKQYEQSIEILIGEE